MTNLGTKTVIYGQTGIGKTRFVDSLSVSKIIIDLSGNNPNSERVLTLKDFSTSLGSALRSDCELIVIDTLDGLESVIFKDLVKESECKSIEHVDGGYGKGYTRAKEKWETLLGWINQKIIPEGKHVIFTASTDSFDFKNPFGLHYSKFGLRVNKHAAGVIESEMDNIFFMTHAGLFNPEKEGVVFHTEPSIAYLAKNRGGLKEGLQVEDFSNEFKSKVLRHK